MFSTFTQATALVQERFDFPAFLPARRRARGGATGRGAPGCRLLPLPVLKRLGHGHQAPPVVLLAGDEPRSTAGRPVVVVVVVVVAALGRGGRRAGNVLRVALAVAVVAGRGAGEDDARAGRGGGGRSVGRGRGDAVEPAPASGDPVCGRCSLRSRVENQDMQFPGGGISNDYQQTHAC